MTATEKLKMRVYVTLPMKAPGGSYSVNLYVRRRHFTTHHFSSYMDALKYREEYDNSDKIFNPIAYSVRGLPASRYLANLA